MCRRCGAPLHPEPEDRRITIPATLPVRRGAGRGTGVATASRSAPTTAGPSGSAFGAAAAAAAFRNAPPDTLLPGAMPRPDNLLPRATRAKPAPARVHHPPAAAAQPGAHEQRRARAAARTHWRHLVVIAIVAVALTASVVEVWPVVFRADTTPAPTAATAEARASGLLRTVVGGGRTLYAPHHSYSGVTAAALSAQSYRVPIVAATIGARVGEVSMQVTSVGELTLATPADASTCVFARDEPARALTESATMPTGDCRAAAAPATGWRPS